MRRSVSTLLYPLFKQCRENDKNDFDYLQSYYHIAHVTHNRNRIIIKRIIEHMSSSLYLRKNLQ